MVTLSKPISAGQAQAYHKSEFANAKENYYTEGERVRGELSLAKTPSGRKLRLTRERSSHFEAIFHWVRGARWPMSTIEKPRCVAWAVPRQNAIRGEV